MIETEEKPRDLLVIIAELESLKAKTTWQIQPLLDLFKKFDGQANLVIPLMIAGITRVAEDGQIYTSAKSEYCKEVLFKQKPLSPIMSEVTKDIVAKSAERFIESLKGAEFNNQLIKSRELVDSGFADKMIKEQPTVRRVYSEWAEYSILPRVRAGYGKPWMDYLLDEVFDETFK